MPDENIPPELIQQAAALWEAKATFWDGLMGEAGNRFYRELVAPAQMALLDLSTSDSVLEIACGNGVATRDVARVAARVVACDVSPTMVELSRTRAKSAGLSNIEFHVVDATDELALRAVTGQSYDAVLCSMGLMDIPLLDPLMRAASLALTPGGRFVFSITHPSFNHNGARMLEEKEDRNGQIVSTYSIKVSQYLESRAERGVGARGEPESHFYFHRSLAQLLTAAFAAGFVLDAVREPAFPQQEPDRRSFDWANYHEIPPILVCRLRPAV